MALLYVVTRDNIFTDAARNLLLDLQGFKRRQGEPVRAEDGRPNVQSSIVIIVDS
jgi:hypothetical protein